MKQFKALLETIYTLRDPQKGCPWDIKQNSQSLIPYLLEETYELIEAIEKEDHKGIKEELGDVLLHILFQASLAQDDKNFDLEDVCQAINEKLIYRHPHVFADEKVDSISEIKSNWEELKKKKSNRRLFDGVPKQLPSLLRAQRVQEKASSDGFDWEDKEGVLEKFKEEWDEFKEALENNNFAEIEDEFGDLLFTLVNLGRHLKISSEICLKKSIDKFIQRYYEMENLKSKDFDQFTLEEMEKLWQKAKKNLS